MKVQNQNILMEPGKTVDGRDLSEDGKLLDTATSARDPYSLVRRDHIGRADLIASRADVLHTPRKITFTGDVIGSFNFDGSEDIKVNLTQNTPNENKIYTKSEVDALVKRETSLAILSQGDGIHPFAYNGKENVTVRVEFGGIQGDFGILPTVARTDHTHNETYYTKTQIDNGAAFDFKLQVAGNKIQLLNKGTLLAETLLPSLI